MSSWKEHADKVSEIVAQVEVDGQPYVARLEEYDPAKRIIHDEKADIDFPVQMDEKEWKKRLEGQRYSVLRKQGTERAFTGELAKTKATGVYYSAATGQPLFSSDDKFESGTGWPSFTKPITPDAVAYRWDTGLFSRRIEVMDSLSGSHLGHVFDDGPPPTGQRYCMNSASMVFVPEGGDPPELLTP